MSSFLAEYERLDTIELASLYTGIKENAARSPQTYSPQTRLSRASARLSDNKADACSPTPEVHGAPTLLPVPIPVNELLPFV